MASATYRNDLTLVRPKTNWGAVWGGMFTFVAIWSVFGLLGEAIFASSANVNAAHPVTGMSAGMGVWAVILTIIAMYVAGRVTGDLAGVAARGEGAIYGTIMFGLSVIATIVLLGLGGTALSSDAASAAGAHSSYVLTAFSDVGWIGFVALFLGWLAAMGGASSAVKTQIQSVNNVRDLRPAA